MMYIYVGLPMLLEILILIVYSRVICYSQRRNEIKTLKVSKTITRSPKEKEYGSSRSSAKITLLPNTYTGFV
jgi:hypothetical protein